MIRRDFLDDACGKCGKSLDQALSYEKRAVLYVSGEFAGSDGLNVIVTCTCGASTRVAFSVDLPRAA